ncbi:MAG: DUF4870 domain-containing protein [Gammaproteobacteria bacterium]|nr:DUF4870 domain-containing protein [Gammaproteobacteria bacterium]
MSDIIETQDAPLQPAPQKEENTMMPTIIYSLYLANIIIPFTGLIGVIMAYINKSDSDGYLASHYQFQIRTFWIGLLYAVVGGILTMVVIGGILTMAVIGWLIILFYVIWLIIRCVRGFKYLGEKEPMPNPTSWMFG